MKAGVYLQREGIWLLIGGGEETLSKMSHRKSLNNFSIERLLLESAENTASANLKESDNANLNRIQIEQSSSSIQIMKGQRRRSTFSALQVHVLENEFYKHRYVSAEKRAGLAAFLGLSQQQIKIWFQNRRYKTKVKNGGARRSDSNGRNSSGFVGQPIVNVPLQSANPSIFPAWLLQRRASLLAELARQAPRPKLPSPGDHLPTQATNNASPTNQ